MMNDKSDYLIKNRWQLIGIYFSIVIISVFLNIALKLNYEYDLSDTLFTLFVTLLFVKFNTRIK